MASMGHRPESSAQRSCNVFETVSCSRAGGWTNVVQAYLQSARQSVSVPATTLNSPHHRGSIRPRGIHSGFRRNKDSLLAVFNVKHRLF